MSRRLVTTLMSVGLLVLLAGPAAAKLPGFDMEVETGGNTVVVTVTLPDAEFVVPHLDGLLAVYPAETLDEQGRPPYNLDGMPVRLPRVDDAVYRGAVTIEEPGMYAVVPFPGMLGFDPDAEMTAGYPPTTGFVIRPDGYRVGPGVALLLGIAALALLAVSRRGAPEKVQSL